MYIGKAALLSGTTVKTIRHYEAIGLLPTPQRAGKYRLYTPQCVERLALIKCAQQLGFKLKEMREIIQSAPNQPLQWALVSDAIAQKKQLVLNQIAALQHLHAGLVEFEAGFKNAQTTCPVALTLNIR